MMRETKFIFVESGAVSVLHMEPAAVDALIGHHRERGFPVEDLRGAGVWSVLVYPHGFAPKLAGLKGIL